MNPFTDTPTPLQLQVRIPQRVPLTLVGCGGTGSHIASGLISIAGALADRGTQTDIYLVDPDIVEERNVGRQLFSAGDIGYPKAQVLASRLNVAFGARVGGAVRAIDTLDTFCEADPRPGADSELNLVIGAVDNPAARLLISKAVASTYGRLWWLDIGNEHHSGQVALGNATEVELFRRSCELGMITRLPAPHLVYPDLVKAPVKQTKRKQSCAELTATGEQGLMVNRMMAAWACAMLDSFLVRQDLHYFAVAVDLQWGGVRSYAIDVPTLVGVTGLTANQLRGGKDG